jgi:hypothetical protein
MPPNNAGIGVNAAQSMCIAQLPFNLADAQDAIADTTNLDMPRQ